MENPKIEVSTNGKDWSFRGYAPGSCIGLMVEIRNLLSKGYQVRCINSIGEDMAKGL